MIQVQKLTLDDARVGIEAAKNKSIEIQVPMDIAIADESGNILAFERMDGALVGCIQIAIDKAYTAAVLGIPTAEEAKVAQPGGPDFGINTTNGGRIVIFGGGIPVKLGKFTLGAVGCSSGTVDEDSVVAKAGVDAMQSHLREQTKQLQ